MVNEFVGNLPNADNERLQRLEARIMSHGRSGNVVTSVGFASTSPTPAGPRAKETQEALGERSSSSFGSSVSRTIPGIEKVSATPGGGAPPASPDEEHQSSIQNDAPTPNQQQRKRKYATAVAQHTPEKHHSSQYTDGENDGDNNGEEESVQKTPQSSSRQRRRRNDSSPSPSTDNQKGNSDQNEPPSTILSSSENLTTSDKPRAISSSNSLGNSQHLRRRGSLIDGNASKSNQDQQVNLNNAHEVLMRHNSKSQEEASYVSMERSNTSSRGELSGITNGATSRTSGRYNSPGPNGANTSSSGVGSKSALRKALKNQPQIKHYFSAKNSNNTSTSASASTPAPAVTSQHAAVAQTPGTPSAAPTPAPSTSSTDESQVPSTSRSISKTPGRTNSMNVGASKGASKEPSASNGPVTPLRRSHSCSSSSHSHSNNTPAKSPKDLVPSAEVERLKRLAATKDEELARLRNLIEVKEGQAREYEDDLRRTQNDYHDYQTKVAKSLEDLLRKADQERLRKLRQKIVEDGFRLGRLVVQRHGFGPRAKLSETWEEGENFRDIRARQLDVLERRDDLEKKKKAVAKLVRQRRANADPGETSLIDLEAIEMEESIKVELGNLKRIEQELVEERARVDLEKLVYLQSLRRLREEDASRFNRQPVLNNRYLLRELLGKGGFSEVWKGFDLVELRDVAVKVHELNSSWNDVKKASYLKHATREYKIHLSLQHARIVQLYDVFEIDANSFATVLEFCEGTDLEFHLKHRKKLPEREARSILLQILSGLRYLSSGGELSLEDFGGRPSSAADVGRENYVANENSAGASGSEQHHGWSHDNHHEDGMLDEHGHPLEGTNGGALPASSSPFGVTGHFAQPQSKRRPCIIHYDLKPGNILFDGSGGIKITDFGLSKIMEPADTESTGIELTSQGAGTYWYLPPECFRLTGPPPKISSKVDVWSTGVIFYQMLYGMRPFGEGMTQEKVLQQGTITRAFQVDFPEKPQVSNEAKEFIRRCLTYSQEYRPDVKTICQDAYLRQKRV
mmetsp:Transcript_20319/g.39861  ORF Transcript_20319/g.39861 Transcript_20319/m.39861 type:complete len:1026 (-) Transcript_20319:1350-4427(-)